MPRQVWLRDELPERQGIAILTLFTVLQNKHQKVYQQVGILLLFRIFKNKQQKVYQQAGILLLFRIFKNKQQRVYHLSASRYNYSLRFQKIQKLLSESNVEIWNGKQQLLLSHVLKEHSLVCCHCIIVLQVNLFKWLKFKYSIYLLVFLLSSMF